MNEEEDPRSEGWLDRAPAPVAFAVAATCVVAFGVGAVVCWAVDRFERRRR